MRKLPSLLISLGTLCLGTTTRADFDLFFDEANFSGITSVFNNITSFDFTISVDGSLVPGATYNDPALDGVVYHVNGVLSTPTPSGFSSFALSRTIAGAGFYDLSPEATISFAVSPAADLLDGLQISELDGAGLVFTFNAREFNQNPGRYHPPIFTLNSDGTGRLVNANNKSTFPNPNPPIGSGMLVDVQIADEYDVTLSFSPSMTIAAPVPEPSLSALLLGGGLTTFGFRRLRRSR